MERYRTLLEIKIYVFIAHRSLCKEKINLFFVFEAKRSRKQMNENTRKTYKTVYHKSNSIYQSIFLFILTKTNTFWFIWKKKF